jgi:hypothetical protein
MEQTQRFGTLQADYEIWNGTLTYLGGFMNNQSSDRSDTDYTDYPSTAPFSFSTSTINLLDYDFEHQSHELRHIGESGNFSWIVGGAVFLEDARSRIRPCSGCATRTRSSAARPSTWPRSPTRGEADQSAVARDGALLPVPVPRLPAQRPVARHRRGPLLRGHDRLPRADLVPSADQPAAADSPAVLPAGDRRPRRTPVAEVPERGLRLLR